MVKEFSKVNFFLSCSSSNFDQLLRNFFTVKKLFGIFSILSFFTLLGIISPTLLYCQEKESKATYYTLFDQAIGITNSGVFNGVLYVERHPARNNKHKFFESNNFFLGSVKYNEQSYFNVELKYNVYDNELLTRNSEILGSPITILDKDKITVFEINNHRFENTTFSTKKDKNISGFFEILFDNDSLILFKKHKKKIFKKIENEMYYEFKDQHSYYVYFKNNYYVLKKVNFLNNIFSEHKTQLKNIYKRYETIRKTDSDTYITSIITDLYKILILNNNSM